jgi:hypothetical protein
MTTVAILKYGHFENFIKMKSILILLFFTSIAFAQQDKTFPKTAKKSSERVSESGSITFTKTITSLQFDRYTKQEYKDKISRFMKTNRRNYTDLGTYTFHLVMRKGELYILEQKFPEKLILLD